VWIRGTAENTRNCKWIIRIIWTAWHE